MSLTLQNPLKDPSAVLDYVFDWKEEWLATGETITDHTITADTGITADSSTESDGKVTVWLSGGTAGGELQGRVPDYNERRTYGRAHNLDQGGRKVSEIASPMQYWIHHHQHKGKPIENALVDQGWVYSQAPDIALFDTARNKPIERRFRRGGATLVVYPHTAIAGWWYDGILEPPNGFSAILAIGEGQKEVQNIITPNIRVETIGWSYCPILPFQKPKAIKQILFAPIHPSLNGKLRSEAKDVNARVYKRLLEMKGVQINLRVIGDLEKNGLWHSPDVTTTEAQPDGIYAEIDSADLVIGEGMFLSLAVARGKPAIGMNQRVTQKVNWSGRVPKRWNEYNHLQAYPIDFDDGDLTELIDKALDESQVSNWKKRFIGEQLQPEHLSNVLKDIRDERIKQREQ